MCLEQKEEQLIDFPPLRLGAPEVYKQNQKSILLFPHILTCSKIKCSKEKNEQRTKRAIIKEEAKKQMTKNQAHAHEHKQEQAHQGKIVSEGGK